MSAGIYYDLPREQYDAWTDVHWSALKLMGRSALHYRYAVDHPDANDSDLFARGIAGHVAVLEPEKYGGVAFDELAPGGGCYAVWPEANGRRGTKAWDAAEATCRQRRQLLIREKEHEWCVAIAKAVHSHAFARQLIAGGRREVSLRWSHVEPDVVGLAGYALPVKTRIDLVAYRDGLPWALVDLKTTRDASPEAFGRQAAQLEYHGQAALHCDGYSRAVGVDGPLHGIVPLPYFWIAVEESAPHAVAVYRCPPSYLERGRARYRDLLNRVHACDSAKPPTWPGYAAGPMELEFPRWAMPEDGLEEEAA